MRQYKSLFMLIACMCITCMAGCKLDTGSGLLNQTSTGTATLQGVILDATTGARIGGTATGTSPDIQIFLVQGESIRKPSSFIGDDAQATVGEFAFNNIPKGSSDDEEISNQAGIVAKYPDPLSDPNIYKIIVVKNGYQRFEGLVNLYDVDNKVGNIYLFPTDTKAPEYKFTVVTGISDPDNDLPVTNAVVTLTPQNQDPRTFYAVDTEANTTIIPPYITYLEPVTVVTDDTGIATFTSDALAKGLGATYDLSIPATTFNGMDFAAIAAPNGGSYTIGISAVAKTIALTNTTTLVMTQGTLYNAITGERIGGDITKADDLQMVLLEGTSQYKPDSFIGDADDILCGEYAFQTPSMATNKLVVIKKGFQRFEARNIGLGTIASPARHDIYLFPVGFDCPDYSFQIVFNDKPVSGATVYLQPNPDSNQQVTPQPNAADRLSASPGYLPSIKGTTDSKGWVTFAATSLALGAQYKPYVPPLSFEGIELICPATEVASFFAGNAYAANGITNIIKLSDISAGDNKYGLYVTAISNSVDGQIDKTGKLVITFNRPVVLIKGSDGPTGFMATETSPTGALKGIDPVKETLSADGLTLTLEPNWAKAPSAGESDTAIIYSQGNAYIYVVGYPDDDFNLFGLKDSDGAAISGIVNITAPSTPDVGLYITAISNADGKADNDGKLTVSFSRSLTFEAGTANPQGFVAFANDGVLNANNPVIETPSADGLTLTLAPNWDTQPTATGGVTITYSMSGFDGANYTILDGTAPVNNIFSLTDPINNSTISATVKIN